MPVIEQTDYKEEEIQVAPNHGKLNGSPRFDVSRYMWY